MICTVSTVKDSLPNVTNFVQRNLSAGADHMFVFLEGGSHQALRFLGSHPHVTVINTDKGYWGKRRPANLNSRQIINANLVNYALAITHRAEWLFHIDGDECLDIDRQALLGLHNDIEYVRLATKESVSTPEAARDSPVYFKRLLTDDELSLLTVLGMIEAPLNRKYFHGHVSGKVGIRPSLEYGVHIHEARRLHGQTPDNYQSDWLNVLHYDSCTPEEFVRKWQAHIGAGEYTRFRPDKEIVRRAVMGVLDNQHLEPDSKERYLLDIYRRKLQDDVPRLQELGLLESISAAHHNHRPEKFSGPDLAALKQALGRLQMFDKGYFKPSQTRHDPQALLGAIDSKLGVSSTQPEPL